MRHNDITARLHWLNERIADAPDSMNHVQWLYYTSHLRDYARHTQRLIDRQLAHEVLKEVTEFSP